MFESGLFGQGNAFWRWIATDAARPYLTAFAVDRAPPSGSEFFAADPSAEDILDSEHMAEQTGRATPELQSQMSISYAVFCLKKKFTEIWNIKALTPVTYAN